jgi:hypothetical protein
MELVGSSMAHDLGNHIFEQEILLLLGFHVFEELSHSKEVRDLGKLERGSRPLLEYHVSMVLFRSTMVRDLGMSMRVILPFSGYRVFVRHVHNKEAHDPGIDPT